jgi:hypothetical protein
MPAAIGAKVWLAGKQVSLFHMLVTLFTMASVIGRLMSVCIVWSGPKVRTVINPLPHPSLRGMTMLRSGLVPSFVMLTWPRGQCLVGDQQISALVSLT